ncbi:MAG: LUD domain-containing protein [Bacteroidetes bacterium]|nr:LUD domain-containing protein [Bacteroidota bacterium]
MKESTTKEQVLKQIRDALIDKSDNPFPDIDFESSVYNEITESLDITFAEAFNEVSGNFVYCADESDFILNFDQIAINRKWNNIFCIDTDLLAILKNSKLSVSSAEKDFLQQIVGITKCEFLIARLGSIMVSSKQMSGRRMNVYPEVHVIIAYASQLVEDLKHALKLIRNKYDTMPSMISMITGPSRTADIEKTLVMGAHGPKEIYVFLIDDSI